MYLNDSRQKSRKDYVLVHVLYNIQWSWEIHADEPADLQKQGRPEGGGGHPGQWRARGQEQDRQHLGVRAAGRPVCRHHDGPGAAHLQGKGRTVGHVTRAIIKKFYDCNIVELG